MSYADAGHGGINLCWLERGALGRVRFVPTKEHAFCRLPVAKRSFYRERAGDFNRDTRTYRWQHIASGQIVSRTKREMREEFGLRADSLDAIVAGRTATSLGWRLAPAVSLGRGPAVGVSVNPPQP